MLRAIVRLSDLSILGTYDEAHDDPAVEGEAHVPFHPSLVGRSVVVRMGEDGPYIALHPDESPLEDKVKAKQRQLDKELHEFVDSRYTSLQRDAIMRQIDLAEKNSLPNKLAYCQQFENWINGEVLMYYVTKDAEIAACTTIAELDAVSWDYDSLVATDPDVKIAIAYSITD
jgi:hypothetical protein